MPRVGQFVSDPRAGASCRIMLDGGEKAVVYHEKGGFKGGQLTIEVSRFMGFSSDRIFACDLDRPEGQRLLAWLTQGAEVGCVASTPLGPAVEFVREAGTLTELRTRGAAFSSGR